MGRYRSETSWQTEVAASPQNESEDQQAELADIWDLEPEVGTSRCQEETRGRDTAIRPGLECVHHEKDQGPGAKLRGTVDHLLGKGGPQGLPLEAQTNGMSK